MEQFERPLSSIKIGEQKIIAIVNDTPYVSDLQKEFYVTILKERKEKILDFSFLKLTW